MRIRFFGLSVFFILCCATLGHAAPQPTYYLALGDSLSVGIQPSSSGVDVATDQGYPDDLYDLLHLTMPRLSLTKLGCSGETSTTMIQGGICTYPEGSQLAAAISFLQSHDVRLVTIDIGANDIDQCISLGGLNQACVTAAFASVSGDLPYILRTLRQAAGPNTLIVGMNYYDPFLVAWELGSEGQALAQASLQVATQFNTVLDSIYQAFAVPVADVATAFRITNFSPVADLNVPVNVLLTATWTWMDAPPPIGPNIHPNAAGYAVIAAAFAKKIVLR